MPPIISPADKKRKLENSGEGVEDFLHGLLVAFCNGGEGELLLACLGYVDDSGMTSV
jgi:hypothetical protein